MIGSTEHAQPSLLLMPRELVVNIANLYLNFVTFLFWRSWPPLAKGVRKTVMNALCNRDIKYLATPRSFSLDSSVKTLRKRKKVDLKEIRAPAKCETFEGKVSSVFRRWVFG